MSRPLNWLFVVSSYIAQIDDMAKQSTESFDDFYKVCKDFGKDSRQGTAKKQAHGSS